MIIVWKYKQDSPYVGYHNFRAVERKRDAKAIERIRNRFDVVAVYKTWNLFTKHRRNYKLLSFDMMMNMSLKVVNDRLISN
jgi:hypothetical protein